MSKDVVGEKVTVSVTGDVTDRVFTGSFRVKTSLSWAERLAQDRIRRELLGEQPGQPMPEVVQAAWMLSRLAVRVVEAPTWWTDAAQDGISGLGLHDDNVIAEVFDAVMRKDVKVARALAAEAEQARLKLAETPPDAV